MRKYVNAFAPEMGLKLYSYRGHTIKMHSTMMDHVPPITSGHLSLWRRADGGWRRRNTEYGLSDDATYQSPDDIQWDNHRDKFAALIPLVVAGRPYINRGGSKLVWPECWDRDGGRIDFRRDAVVPVTGDQGKDDEWPVLGPQWIGEDGEWECGSYYGDDAASSLYFPRMININSRKYAACPLHSNPSFIGYAYLSREEARAILGVERLSSKLIREIGDKLLEEVRVFFASRRNSLAVWKVFDVNQCMVASSRGPVAPDEHGDAYLRSIKQASAAIDRIIRERAHQEQRDFADARKSFDFSTYRSIASHELERLALRYIPEIAARKGGARAARKNITDSTNHLFHFNLTEGNVEDALRGIAGGRVSIYDILTILAARGILPRDRNGNTISTLLVTDYVPKREPTEK